MERRKAKTATYGYQGRSDIPEKIDGASPYFYIHFRPCRPLKPGERWGEDAAMPRLFIGAAMRRYVDRDGMPVRKIIASCDKSRVRSVYQNQLPWLRLALDGFRVPQNRNPWIGNPTIDHTFAIRRAFAADGMDVNFRNRLHRVRGMIELTRGAIARFEQAGDDRMVHVYRNTLAIYEKKEGELVERVKLEERIDRLAYDDACDQWG